LTWWFLEGSIHGLGRSAFIGARVALAFESPWSQAFVFSAVLSLFYGLTTFPFSFARGFVVERQFGLSHQTMDEWFADAVKGMLLGVALGSVVLAVLVACLLHGGGWWWTGMAAFQAVLAVILARVAPQILIPLFYKMKLTARDDLSGRLKALAEKEGVPLLGLFEIDFSRRTATANAAVVGLGSTRRALIGDTMLKDYEVDEVEFVLAHELAHHKYGDMWTGIAVATLTGTAAWAMTHLVLSHLGTEAVAPFPPMAGVEDSFHPLVLHWIAVAVAVFSALFAPLERAVSRFMERRADAFAARATGNASAGARAFRKLGRQNKAVFCPPWWDRNVLHTHPCLAERVARLGG
jgi:STE24 endopeptidase